MLIPSFRAFSGSSALFVSLALASAAHAQGPQGGGGNQRPRLVLLALDTDKDGQLSAAELQTAATALLTLDRNGDGQITQDELDPPRPDAAAINDQLVTQLMSFDKNGDGFLTPDEVPERMHAVFTRGDADHDGKLTPDEIRHMAKRSGAPAGRPTGPGTASGSMIMDPLLNALDSNHDGILSAEEIAAAPTTLAALDADHDGSIEPKEMRVRQASPADRAAHLFEEWDTNKDGKLTKEELPDGMRPRFDEADTNHDGVLDNAEVIQLFANMPAPGAPAAQPKGQQN